MQRLLLPNKILVGWTRLQGQPELAAQLLRRLSNAPN